MSTIILFDKANNNWSSLGLGPLVDAINPKVDRERNGIYTLTFQYPILGPLFKELKISRWVVADAGPSIQSKAQKFEIETITKPIDGIVTVYCEHYRYQLLRSIVKRSSFMTNIPAQTALNHLQTNMLPKGDFNFFSDITTKSSLDLTDPSKFSSVQDVLGGVSGSILDNFGGEYIFDNNQVKLMSAAGKETNIVIAYGKNLTDITQEENIANTFTSVYGWAKVQESDEIITLPEISIASDYTGNYTQERIKMVDFTQDEPKSVAALRTLVKNYIKNNNIGIPKVSIKTSFEDMASSVLSTEFKNLETLDLCDKITVVFNDLDINTTAKVIKTIWNVALDKYDSIELGESQTDFGKVLAEAERNANSVGKRVDWVEKAVEEASNIIKNPGIGNVVIYPSLANPQEILIMDTTDINTAKKVWRWNAGGLGFSSSGYNGSYGLAMTNNGAIVADRITTGVLRAIDIIGVTIQGATVTGGLVSGATIRTYSDGLHLDLELNSGEIVFFDSRDNSPIRSNPASIYASKDSSKTLLEFFSGTNFFMIDSRGQATLSTDLDVHGKSYFRKGITVPSDTSINFYSPLNMNNYPIYNQSDIRLKENITDTEVNGIAETKKLKFFDFNMKQNYQKKDKSAQPNSNRQLGLIAQYTPFLANKNEDSHYLSIDVSKQIMLNSLTNKELIQLVEQQEKRISKLEKIVLTEEQI